MRKKKIKKVKKNNVKLLGIFVLAVVVLVFLSGCIKLAAIIAKSQFDGTHRFTIAAIYSPTEVTYVSLSPADGLASVLHVTSSSAFIPGQSLEIPTDSIITNPPFTSSAQNPGEIFQSLLFHTNSAHITIVDAVRLFMLGRGISNVKTEELKLPLGASEIDAKVADLFKDSAISDEDSNIEIVNATNVSGLGNRMARLLSNMGANVIAVKSADEVKTSSIAYFGKPTYTISKLQKLLHFKTTQMQSKQLSDIIITIGDDSASAGTY